MKVCQAYYRVADLVVLLRFSDSYIRRQIRAGEFGPRKDIISTDGGELRIPATGVNFFLERHSFEPPNGVQARTPGELKRKLKQQEVQTPGHEP